MYRQPIDRVNRHNFVKAAAATTIAAMLTAPAIAVPKVHTVPKSDSVILGEGDHKYRVHHDWAQLPKDLEWQTMHNCTVDRDGLVYIVHERRANRRGHLAIFDFDPEGKYILSFGNQFAGGAHGMDLRQKKDEEFLYVTSCRPKMGAKLSLTGEEVRRNAPMESGNYAPGEEHDNQAAGHNCFLPTNFCFLLDGGFLVADGYGSYWIHGYDDDADWVSCWSGPDAGDATFNEPDGLWYDDRPGRTPPVAVTDRERHVVKFFIPEGQYLHTIDSFLMPCNFDLRGNTMLVPDPISRITLLDKENKPIVHLNPEWRKRIDEQNLRLKPDTWFAGKVVRPHDANFDRDGNIIVTEFVEPGRATKLTRLS